MPLASPPSGRPSGPPSSGSSTTTSVKATPPSVLESDDELDEVAAGAVAGVGASVLVRVDEVRALEVRLVERHPCRGRRWRQRRIGAGGVGDRLGLRPLAVRGRLVVDGAGGNVGRGDPVIALEGPGLVDIEQAIEVVVADRADQRPSESL